MKAKKRISLINKIIDLEVKCGNAMLSGNGTRIQFELSIFLISVIPVFGLAFLAVYDVSIIDKLIIFLFVVLVGFFGYVIVKRYPIAILRLRHDLEKISTGDLPEEISIRTTDADIQSIKTSLDQIMSNARYSIDKIKEQQDNIVKMEREKVMHESVGTTCHHMGQPVSVLSADLHLMRDHPNDVNIDELLQECCGAIDQVATILKKLNTIPEYSPTPYVPDTENPEEVNILSI